MPVMRRLNTHEIVTVISVKEDNTT
jgi:hypothetical protein